jgi:mannosyl-3-phosphoglycerate phosphatase
MPRSIIFTDLDGTLLDHHTYSFEPALEMIDWLKSREIPIIIVTSKTRPEVLKIQARLGIRDPFIVENGAGAFLPVGSPLVGEKEGDSEWAMVSQAKRYDEIRTFFDGVKTRFGMKGFGDMECDEVVALTGLDPESAEDAMHRDFTEPFVMERREALEELAALARLEGLDIVEGGRFFHLVTQGQSKGRSLQTLAALYASCYHDPVRTIALGDNFNDLSMLRVADKPVLIPRHDGSYIESGIEGIIKAPYPGPKGWNAALKELLDA